MMKHLQVLLLSSHSQFGYECDFTGFTGKVKAGVQSGEVGTAAPSQRARGTLRLRDNQGQDRRSGGGTQRFKLGPLSLSRTPSRGSRRAVDSQTVFVAGATGRLGARIVRQLLLQGFTCALNQM